MPDIQRRHEFSRSYGSDTEAAIRRLRQPPRQPHDGRSRAEKDQDAQAARDRQAGTEAGRQWAMHKATAEELAAVNVANAHEMHPAASDAFCAAFVKAAAEFWEEVKGEVVSHKPFAA